METANQVRFMNVYDHQTHQSLLPSLCLVVHGPKLGELYAIPWIGRATPATKQPFPLFLHHLKGGHSNHSHNNEKPYAICTWGLRDFADCKLCPEVFHDPAVEHPFDHPVPCLKSRFSGV